MLVTDLSVVVPVHNEEEWIADSLAALRVAIEQVNVPVRAWVVLDDCTDDTERRLPGWVEAIETDQRDVGMARALGFTQAPANPGSWYATTDADSLVPPDWLQVQVASAREHDVFVGTVEVRDWSPRLPHVRILHEANYRRVRNHRHIHGANLGFSASAYHLAGGFRPGRAHEDVLLVGACLACGLHVDWSDAAPVATSARQSQRTTHGFAATLNQLEEQWG